MDERFLYDFRTGCGNSAKFARIFDMGFIKLSISARVPCESFKNFGITLMFIHMQKTSKYEL